MTIPQFILLCVVALVSLFIIEGIFGRKAAYGCSTVMRVAGMAMMAYAYFTY